MRRGLSPSIVLFEKNGTHARRTHGRHAGSRDGIKCVHDTRSMIYLVGVSDAGANAAAASTTPFDPPITHRVRPPTTATVVPIALLLTSPTASPSALIAAAVLLLSGVRFAGSVKESAAAVGL